MFAVPSLTLDGRIASLLLAAEAANGLVFRVVEAWKEQGADAAFGFFGVSPIELVVIGVAAKLLFEAGNLGGGASANVAAALFALGVVWPSSLLAWPLTASFALFAALGTRGPARAGALVFAALAVWEIWSTVVEPTVSKWLLPLDAGAVARLLSFFRDGVVQYGNVVGQGAGHQIVILVGCSTAHLVPLAVLGATALMLVRLDRLTGASVARIVGLALALGIANLARLTLMAVSSDAYLVIHNGAGPMAFDALNTMLIVAAAQLVPARS